MVSRGCKKNMAYKGCEKNTSNGCKKKNSEKKRKYANIFTITGIFFAKGKRKDQKDQFLAYNMSLFLKEENGRFALRSEEHTSELQSQSNLVCRLLLEKKKKKQLKFIDCYLIIKHYLHVLA